MSPPFLGRCTGTRREHGHRRLLESAISEARRSIIRAPDRHELFGQVCEILVRQARFPLVWVAEPETESPRLRRVAACGAIDCLDHFPMSLDAGEAATPGPAGRALSTGDTEVISDIHGDDTDPALEQFARCCPFAALAAVPLGRAGEATAVLVVHARGAGGLEDAGIRMLVELTVDMSFALDAELRARNLRVADAAFEVQEGIIVTDANGVIERVNSSFSRITGYEAREAIGKTPNLLQSGYHDSAFYAEMWRQIGEHGVWEGEIWNRRKNGELFPEWLTISAVKDTRGRISHYVGSFSDITDSKEDEKRIQRLAFYDPLTELANRRLLMDRLGRALAFSTRNQTCGAVLMLDFDHFKVLNDTRGHAAGDTLLAEAAKRLKSGVRESDSVARIGGDEFVVVLEGLDPDENVASNDAVRRAQQLQSALSKPYALSPFNDYGITVSIGITLFKGRDLLVDDLLKQADVALYEAKADGRNTFRFFNPGQQKAMERRAHLEAELRRAFDNEEFELHYQPQIDRGNEIIGAEALLRWAPPDRPRVPAKDFIRVAEESGQILQLGDWVIGAALDQLRAWQQDPSTRHLTLAVNVSARHFRQPGFVDEIRGHLERSGADPRSLYLELTENVGIEPIDRVMTQFEALESMGVRFSIDDFGTGYSSLSYIQRLRVHQIKIDRTFVDGLPGDANSVAVVRAILAMGHAFGLHVIAEGVENEQQKVFLEEEGCDAFQGFYIGTPVPAGELGKIVSFRTAR
ncbi:MAG: EAL domain-containing protein [Arenicellales bacterium]